MSDDPNFQAALEQVRTLTAERDRAIAALVAAEKRAGDLWDEIVDLRSRFSNVCAQLRHYEETI